MLSYKELNKISKEQKKIKFKVTSRIKRIIMTISLIFILINLPIVIDYNIEYEWIYFLIMFTFTYLSYYIVYLANIINKPIEKMVYYHFYNKAKKKVIEMNNLKVIGVTGSYGKTSCKEILNTMRSTSFRRGYIPSCRFLQRDAGSAWGWWSYR